MKNLIYTLLILTAFTTQSCETDIPPTDTEPPTFSFSISGTDGFRHNFDQDDDFESFQLNLREDTDYYFTLSFGDNGGLNWARMQFVNDLIMIEESSTSGWTKSEITSLQNAFTWQGDRNNPVTGAMLIGSFKSESSDIYNFIGSDFIFLADDYGGQSGDINQTIERLRVLFGNHDAEIVEFGP